jgi:hypothetical protein
MNNDLLTAMLVAVTTLLSVLLVSQTVSAVLLWKLFRRQTPISTGFETEILDTMRRLDERVKPLPKPTVAPEDAEEMIDAIIEEGRRIGEQTAAHNRVNGHKITGQEKQRAAMTHIRKRIEALNLSIDFPLIAARLESSVRKDKEQTK